MSDFDNTNKGAIWANRDKEKDTQPDFKGQLNVNGVEFWVSAWKKGPNASEKAPSLRFSIQSKDEAHKQGMQQVQQATPQAPVASGGSDFDDDIPF